uniref:Carbonic anhydrase n=1 Tax=Catharus ustulatus TaxID=91951 RepID=A0A8C3UHF2_CATUS
MVYERSGGDLERAELKIHFPAAFWGHDLSRFSFTCFISCFSEGNPPQWHLVNGKCSGNKQSPVNIVTKNVVYEKSLKPLTFEGYDVKGSGQWLLENNGHTVKVTLNTSPKIGGGGLPRKFKAVEFHLHWGVPEKPQNIPGSEHSIDGEKYPMELHVVHIREDASDVTDAKKNPGGLAVLAFFVKVGSEIFSYPPQISASSLAEGLFIILNTKVSHSCQDLGKYYRYEGSLTTPDCYEGVIWTIFEKPVELSLRQLSRFAVLHFEKNSSSAMTENFRPAQPLNGRAVLWSGASIALPAAKLLLLPLALTCTLSSLSH